MLHTVGSCINKAKAALRHLDSFYIDAEIIVGFVLNMDRSSIQINWDKSISESDATTIANTVMRRASGEPISYITQRRSFWKGEFFIKTKTLIPRHDSEALIELTLSLFKNKNIALKFLDLGVGSGCLAISLLQEYTNACAVGIDISHDAIVSARENCKKYDLEHRMTFGLQSWSKNIAIRSRVHLIVSNPPYIKCGDMLELEVRYHEPIKALNGGVSGLEKFAEIMRIAGRVLRPDGIIVCEIGMNQKLAPIALQYGFRQIASMRDLQGIVRSVAFRRY